MYNKMIRKRMKMIKKEIKGLKKLYKKVEFRPCQNDAELRLKDEELRAIMDKIYSLEMEQDKFILNSARINQNE
ncbi:hypothetical protein OAC89_04140 [Deltaproteobacteria bacterium]|nr:hypothetical protein [Deltaproteobacteria bacterium]